MKKHIKTEKSYTKQKSLSKAEFELIEKAKSLEFAVLDAKTAERLTGYEKAKVYRLFNSLKRKGFLNEIIKGKYTAETDAFSFASYIFLPSYISFWSALSYYHLTEQLPTTIFLATTKKRKEITFEGRKINFVKLSPKRYFGYRRIENIVIAEKEKAIIDSLLFPRYAGGIAEVFKCLREGWESLDKKTLLEYALRIGNRSLLRRLGFLIEKGNLKISKSLMRQILKNLNKGFSKLDTSSGRGTYNKKWKLIVNIDENRLLEKP